MAELYLDAVLKAGLLPKSWPTSALRDALDLVLVSVPVVLLGKRLIEEGSKIRFGPPAQSSAEKGIGDPSGCNSGTNKSGLVDMVESEGEAALEK